MGALVVGRKLWCERGGTMIGENDGAAAWGDYLRAFHRETPRATSLALELFADAHGRSSYVRLATVLERVPSPSKLAVLDLGCGDGRLVDHIRALTGPEARVAAIDMVPEEIARAAAWGRDGDFVVGDARALPYDDASFGAVLSHFAFMLMVPAPTVVREIERVLRPRGFFAAAISSLSSARADLATLLVPFREALARAGASRLRPPLDARAATAAGIAELFAAAGSSRVLRHAAAPFLANVDADGAWLYLSTLYFFDILDGSARSRLREAVDTLARSRGGRLSLGLTIDFIAMVPAPRAGDFRP